MSNQVLNGSAADAGGGVMTGEPGRGGGRPTMKDVAFRAGVALKTVSRVVNREPGVTPATTRRVLDAIADLGFRRNESARLLRTGRTATLGFIADSWTDPDHASVYRGLEGVARDRGYLLYSGSTDSDHGREERLALDMCARRVDGLVISPAPGSHDYLAAEIEAGVVTVFVLRRPEPARAGPGLPDTGLSDTVLPDEGGAAGAAVAHLAGYGHRRIGFLGDAGGYRSRTLRDAYQAAMTEAGLDRDPAWSELDASQLADGRAGVTAVFCASPRRTHAALRVLAANRDPSGPRRVAVVGFGDLELADLLCPPVTVVGYDPVLIGRTAGELLIRRLAGEQAPPRVIEVPVTLTARGSAEFPPAEG